MDDLALALGDLIANLEREAITYALGGATAFAVWAVPRATLDIDLNIWCAPEGVRAVFARMVAFGVEGDPDDAARHAEAAGVAYLRWRGIRLDVFVPSIEFYEEALRTRVRIVLPRVGATWVLSPEALAVFKLLFFRPKDILDLEKLVRVRGESLDRVYIRTQLVTLVGEDDPRVTRWDALVRGGS
jgi:hypothetical protein